VGNARTADPACVAGPARLRRRSERRGPAPRTPPVAGQFLEDRYWRQTIPRYLRHYTLRVRHRGAGQLLRCGAAEEHPDGSEDSADDALMWDHEGDDVVMTLTRNYLRPNQALTLRWDVPHDPA
jgi:hypothetical protein